MIKTEYYDTRKDGVVLNRTYSDSSKMIQNEKGVLYVEAIDPAHLNRVYTETDVDIDYGEEATESSAF